MFYYEDFSIIKANIDYLKILLYTIVNINHEKTRLHL